ncbi:hypothetical protein PCANC_09538 [Puccinia coronata f. sp. avenae]|uniref:Uncharacterized protein n=1 Tax=Puccinia coronata f. sp. avenae TaxID=200324 RepID=A0A2N5V510_9BASI|nr:hypothetical protein PCANC_09538 [Puccinia coronata f. sp. avenae]
MAPSQSPSPRHPSSSLPPLCQSTRIITPRAAQECKTVKMQAALPNPPSPRQLQFHLGENPKEPSSPAYHLPLKM